MTSRKRPPRPARHSVNGLVLRGTLYQRANGFWYLETGNTPRRSRLSLGTTSLDEAREEFQRRDRAEAVRRGVLPREAVDAADLTIEQGIRLAQGDWTRPDTITRLAGLSIANYTAQDRDFAMLCGEKNIAGRLTSRSRC